MGAYGFRRIWNGDDKRQLNKHLILHQKQDQV